MNEKLDKHHNEKLSYFVLSLRPDALALEKEILQRLGGSPEERGKDVSALRYSSLAGVSPITDAADYLEDLARSL